MLEQFWNKVSGNLGDEWNAQTLVPALLFWIGGLAFWSAHYGWGVLLALAQWSASGAGLVGLVVAILVLVLSLKIVAWWVPALLTYLQGYWTGIFSYPRAWITTLTNRIEQGKEDRWQALAALFSQNKLTPLQREQYAHLDQELLELPVAEELRLPTHFGNLLRAAEEYPLRTYGLEYSITFPRLWFILPDAVQTELREARARLGEQGQLLVWSILFSAWCLWSPLLALVLTLLACWIAVRGLFSAARAYAVLVRAAYDMYRLELYHSLRWPLPQTPDEEKKLGKQLTEYLQRGVLPGEFKYS